MIQRPDPVAGELLLEVKGLVKAFKKRTVVDGVSFQVRAGEIVGLLGANGAGKSTSFRMTVGLTHPDAGEVRLRGEECSRLPMYKRARLGMGYLPQDRSIFQTLSVRDNLRAVLETLPYSHAQRESEATRLIGELELAHVETSIANTLSGGEVRRLELARALATKPLILLLDEPFAGVDPIAVADIQGLVQRMRARNLGILITDHNVRETLQLCDRAYVIGSGKLLKEGTPAEIIRDPLVREKYLGHTFDAPVVGGVSVAEEREMLGS
ncbi:MAG: LPS export ABC transporter ATP-binding protein [Planctomycetaceae bacterium]|jgi:lipopolysaccharide export system ATP-binding protein|nr:LPS export ABC transporter ATP-binding protein [Planctomycetaceae bacterium]